MQLLRPFLSLFSGMHMSHLPLAGAVLDGASCVVPVGRGVHEVCISASHPVIPGVCAADESSGANADMPK
jgi:hypothetical protein